MGRLITLPFAALLRLIYSLSGSYGLSIIFFSLVVTLIMMPFQMKSKRSMVRMGKLSNRQMELQKQYANNQQKYQEELAKLYQEENINPMGGCLWSLLPMFVIVPCTPSSASPSPCSWAWARRCAMPCAPPRRAWATWRRP